MGLAQVAEISHQGTLQKIMQKLVPSIFSQNWPPGGAPEPSCQERLPPVSLNMIPKLATRGYSWVEGATRPGCPNRPLGTLPDQFAPFGHHGALQTVLPRLVTREHSQTDMSKLATRGHSRQSCPNWPSVGTTKPGCPNWPQGGTPDKVTQIGHQGALQDQFVQIGHQWHSRQSF